jgi:ADP-ribose pyrophosphatase YjhB (NUDIX family)
MKLAARVIAPRQCVGAVGAVVNSTGDVLLVEHVFRTDFPWGLPGGWVKAGENPRDAVRREIREELKIEVDVQHLLCSEQVGLTKMSTHPRHLGLAYYCRYISGECVIGTEVQSVEWVDANRIRQELAPFQRKAIELAREVFDRQLSS